MKVDDYVQLQDRVNGENTQPGNMYLSDDWDQKLIYVWPKLKNSVWLD